MYVGECLKKTLEKRIYPECFQEQPEMIDGMKIKNIRLTPEQLNLLHKNAPADKERITREVYIKNGGIIQSHLPIVDIEGRFIGFKDEKEWFEEYVRKLDGRTLPEKILGRVFYGF